MTEKTVSAKAVSSMTFGAGPTPFDFMSGTDWVLTGQTSNTTNQVSITTDEDGEFIPASVKSFGAKTDVSANYESKVNTSITSLASVSVGADDVAVEEISVSTRTGAKATASVRGHSHPDSTLNHKAKERMVVIPSFNGFGASLFGLSCGLDAETVQAGTYTVSIGHVDQTDNVGDHLEGISVGETHTVSFEYVSDTAPTSVSGWTMTNSPEDPATSRDGFVSGTVSYVKYVAG